MKQLRTAVLSVVAIMAVHEFCLAADGSYSPVANVTERWTNGVAWKASGSGVPAVIGEAMSLAYATQDAPFSRYGALKADSSVSHGWFVGNYSNSAITHASFDVMRVGLASEAIIQFTCNNGHVWYYTFSMPAQTGSWAHCDIPFTYTESWTSEEVSGLQAFDVDRAQIKCVDIYSFAPGTAAQEIRIDNFKVVGPWEKGPLTADEMPQYWLLENGLSIQDGQAGLDKDGDGFSNYAEYLAGTDPNDSKSQFRLEIETGTDGKPVLSWKHEAYRSYKVFKSADLSLANSFVEETGSIQTAGDKNRMTVADDSSSVNFYRVQVDKQ